MPPYSIENKCFLFANVNIIPDHYNDWQAAFDELAKHVYANEPNTLTYYFGLPLEHVANPARTDYMFAFEAYSTKSDLYDIHLKSGPMADRFLPAALPTMTTGLDLRHFGAVGGFLDLPGDKTECGIMHDIQIQSVGGEERKRLLAALTTLSGKVEDKVKTDGKGEIVTFMGLKSLDDDTGARIYARYKSREVWEEWLRSDLLKGFWEEVKSGVKSMEARAYAPNGKGWLWK